MRDRSNRNMSFWVVTLVLPALAACGAKPGSQPKKVATESGPAGQAGPVGPGFPPQPGPDNRSGSPNSALGAISQKHLVYHLAKDSVPAVDSVPEQELQIIPQGQGKYLVRLDAFEGGKVTGSEEQLFQLTNPSMSDQFNTDLLEAVGSDGRKLIPAGTIRFEGSKTGDQETGKVFIDFKGAEWQVQANWNYRLVRATIPVGNPSQSHPGRPNPSPDSHPGSAGPASGSQAGGSAETLPPVQAAAPRVLPIRGVLGQPVKFYPLVQQNLGPRVCQAKLFVEPTSEAKTYLLTLESEPCGGLENKSMTKVPVKLIHSANSAFDNQDLFESVEGQLRIEFRGSGFEYVFGSEPSGSGAYDLESGTVQLGGVLYRYDTGRVLKRGQNLR